MTRRAVRLFLFATLTLALGSAAWRVFRLELAISERTSTADAFDQSASRLIAALLDHRASERAFVAPGQGAPYWKARADDSRGIIEREAGTLRLSGAAASAPAIERLGETMSEFLRVSRRIADHALADRSHHAADLIFADAIHASGALEREVRAAREAMSQRARAEIAAIRRQQAVVLIVAAAAALLVALALVPEGSSGTTGETAASGPIRLDVVDHTPRPAAMATPVPGLRSTERAASPAALQAAADVCGGLARVMDSRELPALLERMSTVIDARGTILWVVDDRGKLLRATLAHGYASTTLRHFGAITIDSDTPAAHAFRLGEPRTVSGHGDAASALVVPVVSAAGPVGVLTVELAPGQERQPATLALARIFAAQLAGLIAPTTTDAAAETGTGASR